MTGKAPSNKVEIEKQIIEEKSSKNYLIEDSIPSSRLRKWDWNWEISEISQNYNCKRQIQFKKLQKLNQLLY